MNNGNTSVLACQALTFYQRESTFKLIVLSVCRQARLPDGQAGPEEVSKMVEAIIKGARFDRLWFQDRDGETEFGLSGREGSGINSDAKDGGILREVGKGWVKSHQAFHDALDEAVRAGKLSERSRQNDFTEMLDLTSTHGSLPFEVCHKHRVGSGGVEEVIYSDDPRYLERIGRA